MLRSSHGLSVLVVLVVAAAAALVGSSASAEGPSPTSIDGGPAEVLGQWWDRTDGEPAAPDTVTFTVEVATGYGAPVERRTVQLQRRQGDGSWLTVAAPLLDAYGKAEEDERVRHPGTYRWRFDDGTDLVASETPTFEVSVMRDLNAGWQVRRKAVRFVGNVNPGWGAKPVRLQRSRCDTCAWKTVDRVRSASNGAWSFRIPRPRAGADRTYRAWVPARGGFAQSTSAVVTVPRRS